MKNKKVKILIFLILMIFIGKIGVFANTSTGIIEKKPILSYDGTKVIQSDYGTEGYPSFGYKYSSNGSYICTSGLKYYAPNSLSCELANNSLQIEKSIGLAYLVNTFTGKNGGYANMYEQLGKYDEYYWLEIAVLYYLNDSLNIVNDTVTENMENVKNTKVVLNGKTLDLILADADAYASKYKDDKYSKDVNISLSETELRFTASEDGHFYSQKIYITDVNANADNINISTDNSNFILIDQKDATGRYFQLKIDKNKLIGSMQNVNVTVTGNFEYYTANYYNCPNDGSVQDIISTVTNKQSKSNSKVATGQVGLTKIIVKKLNENGEFLSGAVIKVENKDKSYSKTFTTTNQELVIEELAYGEYNVTEIQAPEGYTLTEQSYNVILSQSKLSETVTIQNNLIRIKINKVDAGNNEFLPGAILQIQDEKGNIVKDKNGKEYEWTTENSSYVVEGLPIGVYYLVEKSAPDRYVLNSDKIKFEIANNTKSFDISMYNSINTVSISKLSIVNKKELPGATLEIQDEEGNIVEFCVDEEGNENTACKWVSTETPYEIHGMPNGKYYLVETIAPKGYVLNKEKIEFVVDGTKLDVKVEMMNELEVDVPDTLSSRSTLLIAISMFDIALGIGILTYVKKNKVQE